MNLFILAAGLFSFVVLGDNRGDDTGQQPPAFHEVIHAVRAVSPAFVVNTGDMIYGRTKDAAEAREQWRSYFAAIAPLRAPVFHIPGNHDLWDAGSAELFREFCGPTYRAFDWGGSRFLLLDTETDPGRLGATQWEWLQQQLADAGTRNVFVFLHQPLFPVDGHIGSSLDRYPAERDRLHRLFAQHRVKAVFQGHEHVYHCALRDSVPYFITGGAGAPVYVPTELGGLHHFILVHVNGTNVTTELRRVAPPVAAAARPRRIQPGEILENWDAPLFWDSWDYTTITEITTARASEGRRGLRLSFDLAQCPWPVLSVALPNLRDVDSASIDVFVPSRIPLTLTGKFEGRQEHEAPPVTLRPGWNSVRTTLSAERNGLRNLSWIISSTSTTAQGWVVFDNFRAGALRESWERGLLWHAWDESVTPQAAAPHGVQLDFDFAKYARPTLYARLRPAWDLRTVRALTVKVIAGDELTLTPTFVASDEQHCAAPPVALHPGTNTVTVDRLPVVIEQVEWVLSSPNPQLRGTVTFERLEAAGK